MLVPDYEESSSSEESEEAEECGALALTDRLLDDAEPVQTDKASQKRSLLPPASHLFEKVERPSFLNPEANKRTKICAAHVGSKPAASAEQPQHEFARQADITKMAPRLKGQPDTQAVLSAPAQRRTEPAAEKKQALIGNDALIAMMGGAGHVDQKQEKANKPTLATTVEDAMAEPSAVQLPRHKQDRKNKEKSKRALGQSSHSHWKSEAEMVLRQQFDS